MILHIQGPDNQAVQAARRRIETLTQQWDTTLTDLDPQTLPGDTHKDIDPATMLAAASLAVSIPSAVLAVTDLVDRINKRNRATQLVDQAKDIRSNGVTIYLTDGDTPIIIATATADDLLTTLTPPPADPN